MRSRLRTLCVAFCLFTLSTEKSYAQVFCADDETDWYVRVPLDPPYCSIGQMPERPLQCYALGDDEVGPSVGYHVNGQQWYHAVKRGVKASSWNVDSVWTIVSGPTMIAEHYSPPKLDRHEFNVVRLCPDERTGELAAIVTVTPSQLMLLGWRIRNDIQHIAAASPLMRDLNGSHKTHYRGLNALEEANALVELSGLYQSHLAYMASFEFPYRKAYARLRQLGDPDSRQGLRDLHNEIEGHVKQCHDAFLPFLERIVALSLQNKSGVVPITSVVLTNYAELEALVPDCIPVVHPKTNVDPVQAYGTIGPSDVPCPRWTACFALDDRDAIARLNDQGFDHGKMWVDAIRRGVDVSAWDASRVWVHITSLLWPSFEPMGWPSKDLQSEAFTPIRQVRRGRDGATIAVVTITPAQLLRTAWTRPWQGFNRDSPHGGPYSRPWLDRGAISREYWGLRENVKSSPMSFVVDEVPPHIPDFILPYGSGPSLKGWYPTIEDGIVRSPSAYMPFLERFVALSLARPGTVVSADVVLSDPRADLRWLPPERAVRKLEERPTASHSGQSKPKSLLQSVMGWFEDLFSR